METEEIQLISASGNDDWISLLEESLTQADYEIVELRRRVSELEARTRHFDELNHSSAFRISLKLSHFCGRIAPRGTRRRRVLALGYRFLRTVSRLRRGRVFAQSVWRFCRRAYCGLAALILACRFEENQFVGFELARVRTLPDLPRFPSLDRVDVSIIVPVSNRWRDCLASLRSIAEFTDKPTYELIAVHDGSSREIAEQLRRIPEVVTLRNDANLGFVGACNLGAASARGAYLVFLKSDTVVTAGWLEALAGTFRDIAGTGFAGAKVIDPDGRLNEAGSIIWRDGTRWAYGNSDDAGHPRYNFARQVDCCSGAGVMIPRVLFEQFGGFDSKFTVGHYESTDLAFKIHQAGHKVIYQPHATIIQRERLDPGIGHDSPGTPSQIVNRERFLERWSEQLDFRPAAPPPDLDRIRYLRDTVATSRGRVLIIDHKLPFFDQDAGSLRMMEMIRAISVTNHHVTFIPSDLTGHPGYLENLQAIGVEVIHKPYYHSVAEYLHSHGREFNLAIISRPSIAASHMTTVRRLAPQARIVFDTVDLHFVRERRQANVTQDSSLESGAAMRKLQELKLAMRSDLTLVVSPVEKEILEAECPGIDVRILSTIHQVEETEIPGFDGRRNIVFIGGFQHLPNPDAVLYFAREIFPLVRERLPDAVFQIIGPDTPPEVVALTRRVSRSWGTWRTSGRCSIARGFRWRRFVLEPESKGK